MSNLSSLTAKQLIQAANLKDRIEALEKQLAVILGGSVSSKGSAPKKRAGMSAATRAKMAAAQQARWAKIKGTKPAPAKKKSTMSAEGRARIAAAAKARWAKAKAEGKTSL